MSDELSSLTRFALQPPRPSRHRKHSHVSRHVTHTCAKWQATVALGLHTVRERGRDQHDNGFPCICTLPKRQQHPLPAPSTSRHCRHIMHAFGTKQVINKRKPTLAARTEYACASTPDQPLHTPRLQADLHCEQRPLAPIDPCPCTTALHCTPPHPVSPCSTALAHVQRTQRAEGWHDSVMCTRAAPKCNALR
jgi:hypothetical protein